jgi:pyruvate formate lyase activating enzyme
MASAKGIIFNLKKYAVHDGPGIRTTVFFQGCSLNCIWCHNPESRATKGKKILSEAERNCLRPFSTKIEENNAREVSVKELMNEIKKDAIFYSESNGGVTFSGGEPLLQLDFLLELLKQCQKEHIHTAVDTAGYVPWENFEKIYDYVDLFLYDLKLIDNKSHVKYIGVSNELILENLKKLSQIKQNIVVRIPLVPGITDKSKNLQDIVFYLKKIKTVKRIDLLPYNPMGEEKYKKLKISNILGKMKHQSKKQLLGIKNEIKKHSFNVNIEG